ncbi:MAG TPA: methyltransferase domain-containing protein [Acidobacteriota bacterium]
MRRTPSDRWKEAQKLEKEWWLRWKNRSDMQEVRMQMQKDAADHTALLRQYLKIPSDPSVLQIGTGAQGFVHFCEGTKFLFDPLSIFFKQNFSELVSPESRIVEGIGESLPFKNNSFDVIFYVQTIDHVDRPLDTVREILRIAKPGAAIMISGHVFSSFAAVLHATFGKIVDPMHPHSLTARGLKKLILQPSVDGKHLVILKEQENPIIIPIYPGFPLLQRLGIILGFSPKYLYFILRCE